MTPKGSTLNRGDTEYINSSKLLNFTHGTTSEYHLIELISNLNFTLEVTYSNMKLTTNPLIIFETKKGLGGN